MTVKKTIITLFIGIVLIVTASFLFEFLFPKPKKVTLLQTPVAGVVKSPNKSSIQAVAQAQAEEQTGKAFSIDGSQTFTMKTAGGTSSTDYSFYIQDSLIFSQSASNSSSFSIPDNAWDPGGKYVFIKKTQDGVVGDLVLKTSGEEFAPGQKYLDVSELYRQKDFPYIYKGATGWAAIDLMVIDTVNSDGTEGPLFWFEVPSESFTQLSQ